LTEDQVRDVVLFTTLLDAQDKTLITKDINGIYHFSGHFRNARDVGQALEALKQDPKVSDLVAAESEKITALFEETFHHDEFTGRSGTFFAYEGLGSIYWHMVSKLLLAVQETVLRLKDDASAHSLIERYVEIRSGLGFNKSPEVYGAFPTDPYSHTPKGQGAKQPGMTGMVKEEILTRMAELGLYIQNGQLIFDMLLLNPEELLIESSTFSWPDVAGQSQALELAPGSLAYTLCQVPIILQVSHHIGIEVFRTDGGTETIVGQALDKANSRHVFMRDGLVHHLCVYFITQNKKSE
jgi:hypothetical protein